MVNCFQSLAPVRSESFKSCMRAKENGIKKSFKPGVDNNEKNAVKFLKNTFYQPLSQEVLFLKATRLLGCKQRTEELTAP